jgi:hypothetical protein
MAKERIKKSRKSNRVMSNSVKNLSAQDMFLISSALSEQMMAMMKEVAITPQGLGTATCALAMVWATLKDVASCQGVNIVKLFESEVAFYEGVIIGE